jgi:hypothetical protein
MNQAELQQSLQRIASQFQGRIAPGGGDPGATALAESTKGALLRQSLLYQSAILEIATGPLPEVNLLDMAVFAELGTAALDRHWIPEVFGESGAQFRDGFHNLELDLQPILAATLDSRQRRQLDGLIADWQRDNPKEIHTQAVRLLGFAGVAGAAAEKRAEAARGLLGSVKSATLAADQAFLLADRAMFLVQRVPFLLRGQLRVGAQDVVRDTVGSALEAVSALERRLPSAADLQRVLQASSALAQDVTERLDRLVRRWILYLATALAACTVLFWLSYWVAKRLTAGT